MAVEFDKVWVDRAWVELERALDALGEYNFKDALDNLSEALYSLASAAYPLGDGWAECVAGKLEVSAELLGDAVEILDEQGFKLRKERGGGEGQEG